MNVAVPTTFGFALCAGAGGLELGLHLADPSYRTVCIVERGAFPAATLVARMADKALDDAPIWSDLRTFDARPWRGVVDIVSAGYPCQPFSSAGKKLGAADPRHLWPDVRRIIDECRPRRVFLENVVGHVLRGFDSVVGDLQGLGFRVAAGVFAAAEVGASHERKRLFILADADRCDERQPPRSDLGGEAGLSEADLSVLHRGGGSGLVRPVGDADDPGGGADGSDIPLFAPGPSDFGVWTQVLDTHPHLFPGMAGLDDGLAARLDRSHLAGNGVCPLAAAYAYRTLDTALSGA